MRPPPSLAAYGPEIAFILGSGWSPLAEWLEERWEIPWEDFPELPRPVVAGHPGRMICGKWGGRRVVVACGRAHLYEGWSAAQTAAPVRLFAAAGVRILLACNAAGAVSPQLRPGDAMLIADHLNLTAQSPLSGAASFVDMREAYSPRLRSLLARAARQQGVELREGIYACVPGPQFETPAEIRMLRAAGADAVGMSTVAEIIQARALGLEAAAISLITNFAADAPGTDLAHEEVLRMAAASIPKLRSVLEAALPTF